MKLAIFGATGRTGQHLVRQALERGHEVVAFARSPQKLEPDGDRLTVVQGDVQDAAKVAEAVAGADAVVSVLGPTENKPAFAVTKGTQNILDAMRQHGVQRLVLSAGAGVGDPNDAPKLINRVINALLKLVSRWVYEDMKRVVDTVRQSDVDWTVVRVPMLTDDPAGGTVTAAYVGRGMGMRLSREDMASFMLDQVTDDTYLHQAPAISS